jgi:hypothetical protein
MPKQNRPLVRDGRLQVKKKRTDRSYLRPASSAPSPAETAVVDEEIEDEVATGADVAEMGIDAEAPPDAPLPGTAAVDPPAAFTPSSTRAVPPAPAAAIQPRSAPNRLPTAVRAMQQQGVRRRREFDVHALAIRDTQYAFHELRRIAILATMVIITLVILWFLLR